MLYFLYLYLAGISNRLRFIAAIIFRLGLCAVSIEYLCLAAHDCPFYFQQLISYVKFTWMVIWGGLFLTLCPSSNCINNILTLYKYDQFLRHSLIIRLLRMIKRYIQQELCSENPHGGWYQRLVTPKRIRYLALSFYLYDLGKAYKQRGADFLIFIVLYLAFISATWVYMKVTGESIYYAPLISSSINWGMTIGGFLIFKALLFPDWNTIKNSAVQILLRVVLHQSGYIKFSFKLDNYLNKYYKKKV